MSSLVSYAPVPAAGANGYDRRASLERLGKYDILGLLAVGGMAEIYLAREHGNEGFERLVVVKQILKQFEADAAFVNMLLDEARLAATLQHANIVQVFDIGSANGRHFFAMEYLHGQDLGKVLGRAAAAKRRLPLEQALTIVRGACAGLHYAHERTDMDAQPLGIVHRDVSPGNIVVTFDGGVKLVDFGIAKAAARRSKTFEGVVKGKVSYMSPEQCCGKPLDRRSDVFSLGVVLWELTTGRKLFKGTSDYVIANQLLNDEIPLPSSRVDGYPSALERIVMRALCRDPDERPETAQELQLEIEELAREQKMALSAVALGQFMRELFGEDAEPWAEIQSARDGTATMLDRAAQATAPRRRGLRWVIGAAAAALLAVGSLFTLAQTRRSEPVSSPAADGSAKRAPDLPASRAPAQPPTEPADAASELARTRSGTPPPGSEPAKPTSASAPPSDPAQPPSSEVIDTSSAERKRRKATRSRARRRLPPDLEALRKRLSEPDAK